MYSETSSNSTLAEAREADAQVLQKLADMHLCTVSEAGYDRYLSGEVLPEMRTEPKGIAHAVEQTLREAFKRARIDVSPFGNMPIHLNCDHRGNAEAWRLEYTKGWAAAAKRLLEKTRNEQRGIALDL